MTVTEGAAGLGRSVTLGWPGGQQNAWWRVVGGGSRRQPRAPGGDDSALTDSPVSPGPCRLGQVPARRRLHCARIWKSPNARHHGISAADPG